tara:strand:+ start:192 stop:308 length:117 start_codon:yes stop_codon:yes gene_type:complete
MDIILGLVASVAILLCFKLLYESELMIEELKKEREEDK